ncbi:MAG: TRAP transporter small permease subunit [Cyclobacteriaceae bacterium]
MIVIDLLVRWVGRFVSWFTLVLVLVIVVDVFFRYTLSITSAASFELEWHLFAALFLLGSAWTLQADKHVRVDLFYHKFSERGRAIVNLVGSVFLLLPFCYVGFSESLSFVAGSFDMGETSADPGGLPARYIIKATIPSGFLLLGLQGISEALKSFKTLVNA